MASFSNTAYRQFCYFVGYVGVALVVYGYWSSVSGETLPVAETWAPVLSSLMTAAGLLVTAASIYFYEPRPHPPSRWSLIVVSPLMILVACLLMVWVWRGQAHPMFVAGCGLLAISGALFRVGPPPDGGD